jgi:nanoRNase/pAp phosphatase (c-di-AMP/oligoRNAs hydrolase)
MVRWVVLGSSSLAVRTARSLADRPGDLLVVTDDDDRARTLMDAGITVREADPTAPVALADLSTADVVAALDADPDVNEAIARRTLATYPRAHLVAYAGAEPATDGSRLADLADRVIDGAQVTTDFLLDRIGDAGMQTRQLLRVLRGVDRLAVLAHDNPDPDAIASAVALTRLAGAVGCDATACYYGEISHQENRAFVNLLEYDLRRLEPGEPLEDVDGIALVDHSRPGVNDQLPSETSIDVVIDHHPPRYPVDAQFVDLRSDVGATSTLLVDYLRDSGLDFPTDVATGLLFGIRIDTDEFTRGASAADFEAAATLLPHADVGLLERVESPSMSGQTLDVIADAIGNRRREGPVLLTCVGHIRSREALAQAADRLVNLEDVSTSVVFGVSEETIFISARSRGSAVDLGETLRDAFVQIGNAGGHDDMAGAQIRLGVLGAVEDRDESLIEIVEAMVSTRFIEAFEARTDQTISGVCAPADHDTEQYLAPAEEREGSDDG